MNIAGNDKQELKHFLELLVIGLIALGVLGASLWLSPYFFSQDTEALYRYVLLRGPWALVSIFILISSVIMFDYVTPGDSLKRIYDDPFSTSMVMSALIVSVGLIIAFG